MFLSQRDYDIRISHNAGRIAQKCTPNVVSTIADCIVNDAAEKDNGFFSSKNIWHNDYTVKYAESVFKKPIPDETKARNGYDKIYYVLFISLEVDLLSRIENGDYMTSF